MAVRKEIEVGVVAVQLTCPPVRPVQRGVAGVVDNRPAIARYHSMCAVRLPLGAAAVNTRGWGWLGPNLHASFNGK